MDEVKWSGEEAAPHIPLLLFKQEFRGRAKKAEQEIGGYKAPYPPEIASTYLQLKQVLGVEDFR